MRPLDPSVRVHLHPARRPLTAVVCAGAVQAILVVAQAFVVAGGVVALVQGAPLEAWVIAVLVVTGLRAVTSYVGDAAAARAAALAGAALRRTLLQRLVLELPGEGTRSVGSLSVLATRGVQETEPYLTRYLPALVLATVLPPISILAIATQDLLSAVIVLLTLPLVPLFAALVGWRTRERASRQWQQMSLLAGHFLDVVKGLPTLVAFRRADHQTRTIRSITNRYRVATMSTLRLAFASSAVMELVATISVALVAVSVGLRLVDGSLDLRTGLTVLLLAPEAYWPIRRLGAEFHAAAQGAAAFRDADQVLAGSPGPPVFAKAPVGSPYRAVHLSLRDATVTYAGQPTPALAATTVDLRGPGLVVVTGPSGAGKSTLLATLQGRTALSCGVIRVNGERLDDVDPDWWSSHVAWTPQRPFFIRGSVSDNIRLGRPDATDEELWLALDLVDLTTTVRSLPDGLDSAVDQDGLSLSAGERARLALARVVVAGRPVVLLDEPTAHLDARTEERVLDVLGQLSRLALVVVVAHRPAMFAVADQVVRLSCAEVVERPRAPAASDGRDHGDLATCALASSASARVDVTDASLAEAPDPPSSRRSAWLVGAGTLLGVLASTAGVALTATAGWLIVTASTHPPVLLLLVAIVAVRMFGIARPALRYAERLVSHDAALRMLAERRAQVFAALVPLTPGRLGRRRGDALSSVVDDVEAFVDRRLRVAMPLAIMALSGAVGIAVAAVLLPTVAWLYLALILAGTAVFGIVRWRALRGDAAWVESRATLTQEITEVLEGADELRAWNAAERSLVKCDAMSVRSENLLARSSRLVAGGRAAIVLAVGSAVAASLIAVSPAVEAGHLSAAMAALLVLAPLAMADLLSPAPDAAVVDVRSRRALGRLESLLAQSPMVEDPDCPLPIASGPESLEAVAVTAGWGSTPVLSSFDLSLEAGSRIGVVGPSGSGKSTLAALLVRFLDPTSGSVRYGRADLRSCSLDDVRRTVGLLDDDPHIFATTVVENVRLARPGSTDAEVASALRTASLGPWIESLPAGLHTWVGEGNRAVSGGERARLGMARVILADQRVLVLDEPTAHLDRQTATEVMSAVMQGTGMRSIVLMTHRPEGLNLVDQILSLERVVRCPTLNPDHDENPCGQWGPALVLNPR